MNSPSSRRQFIKKSGLALTAFALPIPFQTTLNGTDMNTTKLMDTIVIGGSYSGLAAAMALGRALKQVIVIDSGKPCNAQTSFSHNFLTQDGKKPSEIAALGRQQVLQYPTVKLVNGLAIQGKKTKKGFEITLETGETFEALQLIFATGIKDNMPNIEGFADCWGISAIHCPYCHGYEVRHTKTGILGNGEFGFEWAKMIANWTSDLTLYTNGKSTLTDEQQAKLKAHHIGIVETEILKLNHVKGHMEQIVFTDGTQAPLTALYAPRPFVQHCPIPESLGCELTEDGYIKVNAAQETSVVGVYASGDNTTRMRTVANAVATGTAAGMSASKKLILEQF
ncbi:NAD(P)/FAD-dependent oxidoreductase [Flavobacterium silvisoli]|uniref:NAD(P)/FAD-dependent oxidoreductase n=1 Tax=Flavobacterium silvisoli TaxID=2529433 RepID=A0A4Q9Z1J9_9FLAO|nr:NAD(P)/FAD-dependent oxidoreductase [Flavobacterium silvisoli]TBX70135.1 NAD(P)/FAD-dependent oxidoreductase [Flavobacterium silvisoli]